MPRYGWLPKPQQEHPSKPRDARDAKSIPPSPGFRKASLAKSIPASLATHEPRLEAVRLTRLEAATIEASSD